MTKKPYTIQTFLTGLILLSYSSTILAQSSPYITDQGLIELGNTLDESLAEIAKENSYTLERDYTYLAIPNSNVAIIFAGGIVAGIMIGSAFKGLTSFNITSMFVTLTLTVTGQHNVFTIGIVNGITATVVRTDAPNPLPCQNALQDSTNFIRTDDAFDASDFTTIPARPLLKDHDSLAYVIAFIISNFNFSPFPLRSSTDPTLNDLRYNPDPNRLEVHYKVASDTDPQDQIENSCFVHLKRKGDYIHGEVDGCAWEEDIFPQNTPGSVRIDTSFDENIEHFFGKRVKDSFDRITGQTQVVTKFSIHDPVH